MLPFRRCHIRRWGGALRLLYRRGQIDDGAARRWFHGFDGAGLWYRRRGTGHDANGTVVDGLTEIVVNDRQNQLNQAQSGSGFWDTVGKIASAVGTRRASARFSLIHILVPHSRGLYP